MTGTIPGHDRLAGAALAQMRAEHSGRKTVWNNTTRGKKLATSVFSGDDIRQGLLANAAGVVASHLAGERLPSLDALAVLVTRDHDYPSGATWADAHTELGKHLTLGAADLAQITDARPLGIPLLGAAPWTPARIPKPLVPEEAVTLTASPSPGAPSATADQVVIGNSASDALAASTSVVLGATSLMRLPQVVAGWLADDISTVETC